MEAVGFAERCRQGWWPSSEFVLFTQSRLPLLDSHEVMLPSLNIDFYWKVGNGGDPGVAEVCCLCSLGISVKGGRFRILAVLDVSSRFKSPRVQFYNGQKLRGLPIYGLHPHYLIYTLVSLRLLIESYPYPSSLQTPPGSYEELLL